jgi:thiamine kinase-like enzyme
MQKTLGNVMRVIALRDRTEGQIIKLMCELHKKNPDIEELKAAGQCAFNSLDAMRKTHRTIERKTKDLLFALWEDQHGL